MRTAKVTAKREENQSNQETLRDKAAQVEHHQVAPTALPGRLLASDEM